MLSEQQIESLYEYICLYLDITEEGKKVDKKIIIQQRSYTYA